MQKRKNASGDIGTAKDGSPLDLLYRNVVKKFVTTTEDYHSALTNLEGEYPEKESVLLKSHRADLARIRKDYAEEKERVNKTRRDELDRLETRKNKEISEVRIELTRLRKKAQAILTASSVQIDKALSALQKTGLGHLLSSLDHQAYLPEASPPNIDTMKASPPSRPRGRRRFIDVTNISNVKDKEIGVSVLSSSLLEDITGDLKSPRWQEPTLSDNLNSHLSDEILGGRDAIKNVNNRKPDTQGRKEN